MLSAVTSAGGRSRSTPVGAGECLFRWMWMTSGRARTLWCAWLLALTCTACGSDRKQLESPAIVLESEKRASSDLTKEVRGVPCTRNQDCESFFCDRTVCAEPLTKGSFGDTCEPPPPLARKTENRTDLPPTWYRSFWPENSCGGYLCIDHLCRSCQSDAECQKYVGPSTCGKFGDWPGKQCGRRVDIGSDQSATPPPTTSPYPKDP
jgi:hypothetical protein